LGDTWPWASRINSAPDKNAFNVSDQTAPRQLRCFGLRLRDPVNIVGIRKTI
jgi:hypothetical protein